MAELMDRITANSTPEPNTGCWLWLGRVDRHGYAELSVGQKRHVNVSREVCAAARGAPPTPQHEAAHSCGNGHLGCVSEDHLSWKTHLDNESDKTTHGTLRRGTDVPTNKLTEDEVRTIRAIEPYMSHGAIARYYGVDRKTITHIVNGKSWRWLV